MKNKKLKKEVQRVTFQNFPAAIILINDPFDKLNDGSKDKKRYLIGLNGHLNKLSGRSKIKWHHLID